MNIGMQDFIEWCNLNQGFLLILLTAVYVLTTYFIYRANRKSIIIMNQSLQASKDSADAMYDSIDLEQHIQDQNAKIALWDKRINLYDNLIILMSQFSMEEYKKDYVSTVIKVCNHGKYLFNENVSAKIFTVGDMLIELHKSYSKLKTKKETEPQSQIAAKRLQLIMKARADLKEVAELISSYLDLQSVGDDKS